MYFILFFGKKLFLKPLDNYSDIQSMSAGW